MLTKSILEWSIFTNNVSEIKIMLVVFSLILILFITYHINNERLIDLLYGDQLMRRSINEYTHSETFHIYTHDINRLFNL